MEIVQEVKKIDKYKIALAEVDALIEKASEEEKSKISESFLIFVKNNKEKTYSFDIDNNKSLLEQNLRKETKILLSLIYRCYFCDEETKKKLEEDDSEYLKSLEYEKSKIYSYDDLFKKTKVEVLKNDDEKNNTEELINYKPSIISRIINKIKLIFKK